MVCADNTVSALCNGDTIGAEVTTAMKTAATIEQQEERKQARDNEQSPPANTRSGKRSKRGGDFSRIAAWAWKPGQSGNPSGRPKHDVAAGIARAVFENNWEALYKAYTKAALRGNGRMNP